MTTVIRPIEDERFNHHVFHGAVEKARSSPGTLTDLDLRHLAVYSDADALDEIVKRRADALKRAGGSRQVPTLEQLATTISTVMADVVTPLRAKASRHESDLDEVRTAIESLRTRLDALEGKS